MAILVSHSAILLPLLPLLLAFNLANAEPFIGVNYGQVADNLPPPSATAKLLQSTAIEKVRLYGSDPAIIKALANTGKGIVIGAANGDVPSLASDPNLAKSWVSSNVVPYYPASNIILITVGNEVITSNDQNLMNQLVPAVQNVQNALDAVSLGGGKIKVSTVHSMAVLKDSEPPSAGKFHPEFDAVLQGLLSFNNATGSPFAINPYPYFAYRSDPGRADNLAFCLFQPNSGRVDSNTNLKYMNMFDAQVDAVRSALDASGFKNVEIVVAETGWPYKGDSNEVGPSLENAKAYNGNLIAHLRSMVGTPLMPGKSVDTYLFALYDEDLKPGPASERAFGLFNPDQSMIYDAGISKQQTNTTSPVAAPTPDVSKSPETTPDLSKSPVTTPDLSKSPVTTPDVSKSPVIPVRTGPRPTANKAEFLNGHETTILQSLIIFFTTTPDVSKSPATPTPTVPSPTTQKPNKAAWCVPKAGVTNVQLQVNLDYACGQGIDCTPIQPGGACFEPNTLLNHAAYAMNLIYQSAGRNPLTCDFSQTAILSTNNPSYNNCVYAGGNA